jgi:DNA-nicking Smr family endonuclease
LKFEPDTELEQKGVFCRGLNRRFLLSMQPVEIPIDGTLDLHTFKPKDVPDLLTDYFAACIEKRIYSIRIVHGKGKGILKKRVLDLLKRHEMVAAYRPAPPEAGGWGATLVELKRN